MVDRVKMQAVAGGGRICFRGDTRDPNEMFQRGFFSREKKSKWKFWQNRDIRYRSGEKGPMYIRAEHADFYTQAGAEVVQGKTLKSSLRTPVETYKFGAQKGQAPQGQDIAKVDKAGDIDPISAVCVTPRFSMAPIFPPKTNSLDGPELTWVYTVYVRELYNSHARQVADGMNAIRSELAIRKKIAEESDKAPWGGAGMVDAYAEDVALWPLYAQELATKVIEAKDVICALKVRRTWKGKDWTYGCDYTMDKDTLVFNRRCEVGKSIISSVGEFLDKEPNGTSPSRSSGFHKNLGPGHIPDEPGVDLVDL
jgi:hypothetical protein